MSEIPIEPTIELHWYRMTEVDYSVTVSDSTFTANKRFLTGTTLDQVHHWAIKMVEANKNEQT